jgi:hypothetical protein
MFRTKWRPVLTEHCEDRDSVHEVLDGHVPFKHVNARGDEKRANKDARAYSDRTQPREENGTNYLGSAEGDEQRIGILHKRVREVDASFDENETGEHCMKRP